MDKRILKISFGKTGTGNVNTKLSVPKKILEDTQVTQEEREVELEYNKETKEIVIKKAK